MDARTDRASAQYAPDQVGGYCALQLQHPLQERQLGLQHGNDRLGLAEAMRLAGELMVGDVDAALLQLFDDQSRLLGRYHLVVETLEQDHSRR